MSKSSKKNTNGNTTGNTKKAEKTIEEKYQKKELHEHILIRPDSYVGSVKSRKCFMWIFNEDAEEGEAKMVYKEIKYVPAFYKICDEIYVNAADQSKKCKSCNTIKITVDCDTGRITVWNNGDGIDVVVHKEYKIYIPTLIFGNLLTSTHYDPDEKKTTGGKNGFGAKLANIYSVECDIETVDANRGKLFRQKFTNNMYKVHKEVVKDSKSKPYTQFSFIPDFEKFGLKGITSDMMALLKKRAYDLAMTTNTRVFFNDKPIVENDFTKYINLYFPKNGEHKTVIDISNDRWKVCAVYDPTDKLEHQNISFVNSVCTSKGGTHVDHVVNQIVSKLKVSVEKKVKNLQVKPSLIRENLLFFVDATIVNPDFASQTKEDLTTKTADFGSSYKVTDQMIKKISNTGVFENIIANAQARLDATALRDTKNKGPIRLEKLYGAHKANAKDGHLCTLILTEGDSAKTFAMSGTNVIGRDYYGIFPLKGKPLNVRDEKIDKILSNDEIKAIIRIVGLEPGKKYTDTKGLRYGKIMVLADQDSVTGDTPLLLRNANGDIEIKTIDSLTNDWRLDPNGKEYGNTDLSIWTETGWTNIKHVMRHKVNKKIYRVSTNSGIVDVTEDHSLLDINAEKIRPCECKIGLELLHSFPNFDNTVTNIDQDAYVLGLEWSGESINHILNATVETRQSFYQGFKASGTTIKGKMVAQSMYYLCKSLGYGVSIDHDIVNPDTYVLNFDRVDNPNAIKEIFCLGETKQYVYDLETDNHHFQAGVGSMIVHNTDGYHIKGLIMNLFHYFWPSLLKIDGFIQSFATPLVKATKGTGKNVKVLEFTSPLEFEEWKEKNEQKGWKIKYYKGLGTSKASEAQECFSKLDNTLVDYYWDAITEADSKSKDKGKNKKFSSDFIDKDDNDDNNDADADIASPTKIYVPRSKDLCDDAIKLAFDKTRADDRKVWINMFDPTKYINSSDQKISYYDFIHKELITFSVENVARAIPNIMDGFKPSQRKIYYGSVKENIFAEEMRVSELQGAISKRTKYHHGEKSLTDAIVNMAQNYVGSNNINLFMPNGQFGSRLNGGDDAASPRYICTQIDQLAKKIFVEYDYNIIEHQIEDGLEIEPVFYAPIIPMILVNGTNGIGTGYSSKIQPCNPRDIYANIKRLLAGEKTKTMHPWFRHYTGTIEKVETNKYISRAAYTVIDDDTILITDLPIGQWTDNYKAFLDNILDDGAEQRATDKKNAKAVITKSPTTTTARKPVGGSKKGGKKMTKNKKFLANKSKNSNTAKVSKQNPIAAFVKDYTEDCTEIKISFTIKFFPNKLKELIKKGTLEKNLKLVSPLNLTNMHLFDEHSKIKKYNSYGEILKDYARVRLELYQKRKDYLLGKWQKEADILKWKMKFINYVISGKIVVFENGKSKKKTEVMKKLEEYEFPMFIVGAEKNASYSYLTSIQLFDLTDEEVEKLRKQLEDKKTEIAILKKKSPSDLWEEELEEFIEAYDKWDADNNAEYHASMNKRKGETNKKRTKRSLSKKQEA